MHHWAWLMPACTVVCLYGCGGGEDPNAKAEVAGLKEQIAALEKRIGKLEDVLRNHDELDQLNVTKLNVKELRVDQIRSKDVQLEKLVVVGGKLTSTITSGGTAIFDQEGVKRMAIGVDPEKPERALLELRAATGVRGIEMAATKEKSDLRLTGNPSWSISAGGDASTMSVATSQPIFYINVPNQGKVAIYPKPE